MAEEREILTNEAFGTAVRQLARQVVGADHVADTGPIAFPWTSAPPLARRTGT